MVENLEEVENEISDHKSNINESNILIEKYKDQLDNVKNNREFEALTKELEYQTLEIQLSEKKIREAEKKLESKKETIGEAQERLSFKEKDLELKKVELEEIIQKTESKEETLAKKMVRSEKVVEDRLLNAFKKIRNRSKNGLAVVTIVRGTCGGCYNAVPPQIQIEIAQKKEIIACENCGRVIVADDIATAIDKVDRTTPIEEAPKKRRTK